jgi:hypothetical protein
LSLAAQSGNLLGALHILGKQNQPAHGKLANQVAQLVIEPAALKAHHQPLAGLLLYCEILYGQPWAP